jgi:hypothetical protein
MFNMWYMQLLAISVVTAQSVHAVCTVHHTVVTVTVTVVLQACLEGNGSGRHHYVRKNAALACYYIHRNFGETLLPDGPELIYRLGSIYGTTCVFVMRYNVVACRFELNYIHNLI